VSCHKYLLLDIAWRIFDFSIDRFTSSGQKSRLSSFRLIHISYRCLISKNCTDDTKFCFSRSTHFIYFW